MHARIGGTSPGMKRYSALGKGHCTVTSCSRVKNCDCRLCRLFSGAVTKKGAVTREVPHTRHKCAVAGSSRRRNYSQIKLVHCAFTNKQVTAADREQAGAETHTQQVITSY